MIKFAVQVRVDHSRKIGGDTALAKAFVRRLQTSGHQAELIADVVALRALRPDVLLAFNLDQPIELLELCKAAREQGSRIAVYALHHPDTGVKAYLSSELCGLRGLVAGLVRRNPSRYFHMMSILRGISRHQPTVVKNLFRNHKRLISDIVTLTDDLLVSGPSEASELKALLPVFKNVPIWLVPHPVDLEILPQLNLKLRVEHQGRLFLTAGRIESRKNSLAVLEVAEQFPEDRFIFAGTLNETEPSYGEAFKSALRRAPNCEWVGQLELPDLLSAIANADAVLSPSWFEVMSLINLFAYALNTHVISSVHTYDADFLKSNMQRFVPEKSGELAHILATWRVPARSMMTMEDLSKRAKAFTAQTWTGFDEWLAHMEFIVTSSQ